MNSNGVFNTIFDDKDTIYELSEISLAQSHISKNVTTSINTQLYVSGIFELYFETGSGKEDIANTIHDQRRSIICEAFQYNSNSINVPLKNIGNSNKVKTLF